MAKKQASEIETSPVVEPSSEIETSPVVEPSSEIETSPVVTSGLSIKEIASKMIIGKTYTNADGVKLMVVADMYGNRIIKQTEMFGMMEADADDLNGIEL